MAIQSPGTLGIGVDIKWTIPSEISSRTDITHVKVWRSQAENQGYTELDQIPYLAATPGYNDSTGNRGMFYLVTFVASSIPYESPWHITYFLPLPYEAKLIEQIKRATPEVIAKTMTDEDFLVGLNLAVQIFNTYPPETYFTLSDFPRSHVAYIIGLGQLTALTSRFLPISIRDWRYSEPGGVAMDIDRGQKMKDAMEVISKVYTQFLPMIKFDFAWDSPMGVGTVQLPVSMGGVVSRGLLNVLDIFTATGR
jgi:hypothetical protein